MKTFNEMKLDWLENIDWSTALDGRICELDIELNPFELRILEARANGLKIKIETMAQNGRTWIYSVRAIKPTKIDMNENVVNDLRKMFIETGNDWMTISEIFKGSAAYPTLNAHMGWRHDAIRTLKYLAAEGILLAQQYNGGKGRPTTRYKLKL